MLELIAIVFFTRNRDDTVQRNSLLTLSGYLGHPRPGS